MRQLLFILTSILCAWDLKSYAASQRPAQEDIRQQLERLKHEVSNHEAEIHTFEERVNSQEAIVASLRQQVQEATQTFKELAKSSSTSSEGKLSGLESANKSLISDIKQLKTHANESAATLSQYQTKIAELEKTIANQRQDMEHMQGAIQALMQALDPKESLASGKSYKIKPGDNLEKIANANGTTIKAIKELNHLTTDRIIVGQKLLLP